MTTVTVTNRIAAPIEEVFRLFTDIEHWMGRVSGIKKVEVLTAGPFALGTRWRETREAMGREIAEELQVTAFEKNHSYTVTNDAHTTRVDTVFTFEAIPEGTKVSIEFDLEPQSFSARLLSPLGWALSGKIRDVITHDVQDIKHYAETTPHA